MYRIDQSKAARRSGWTALCRLTGLALFLAFLLPLSGASSRTNPDLYWTPKQSGVLARLYAVYFNDRDHGWAVGSNGTVIKTSDGGERWQRQAIPERERREMVRDVWAFKNESKDEGIPDKTCILGEYGILNSKGVYNLTDRVFVLLGSAGEEGWKSGEPARLPLRRPDAVLGRMTINADGKSQVRDPDEYSETLRSTQPVLLRMAFVNESLGWACGESGSIQVTRDGGATWKIQYAQTRKLLYDVAAIDKSRAWIVGAGGTILSTDDGGQVWDEKVSGVTDALRAVHFVDANTGWAVGSNGTIIVTNDGGKRWKPQTAYTKETLNDVFFVNAREGWIAGDRGILLHTSDGGVSWEGEGLETHANLNRLFFVAPDFGWVVGNNGTLLKYGSP